MAARSSVNVLAPFQAAATRPAPRADAAALLESLERLQREFDLLRAREEAELAALRHLEEQLHHAATVQRDLLPATLPAIRGLDVDVFHRSAETLGGDAYDCFRLDDHRIAFVLSDATGHGVPAALLSSYVQRGLRGRGTSPPDDVLREVNADLFGRNLSECQFVAALFAVYDETTGVLRWARGGAPYPVLVRPGEPPRALVSEGPLVGACDSPVFEVAEWTLADGDTVFFYTDGLEAVAPVVADLATQTAAARSTTHREGPPSNSREMRWLGELGCRPISEAILSVRTQTESPAKTGAMLDDVTVFALRRTG